MEFTTSLAKFTTKNAGVYGLHLPVPESISSQFIEGEDRRVICTINDSLVMHSGLMPFEDYWYILMNQANTKKLGLHIGDTVKVHLVKDHSEYGMPMPEELGELLAQDPEGNDHFHRLTPGKQRNLIYIVSSVKNTHGRLNKALAIVDHLKMENGNLDFKRLNALIKEYNVMGKLK